MLLVKRLRACVVNRRFEINRFSALVPEPPLDFVEQPAADPLALPVRDHVDGDDVPEPAQLRGPYNKPNYLVVSFGDQRAALSRANVELKLEVRVRNAFGKCCVVNLKESFEVCVLVVSYFHITREVTASPFKSSLDRLRHLLE